MYCRQDHKDFNQLKKINPKMKILDINNVEVENVTKVAIENILCSRPMFFQSHTSKFQ